MPMSIRQTSGCSRMAAAIAEGASSATAQTTNPSGSSAVWTPDRKAVLPSATRTLIGPELGEGDRPVSVVDLTLAFGSPKNVLPSDGRMGGITWTKGGCAEGTEKEDEVMDANGARDLARLLEERSGRSTPALRPSPLVNAEAAPIFRWL